MESIEINDLKIEEWESFYRLFKQMVLKDFSSFPKQAKMVCLRGGFSSPKLKVKFSQGKTRIFLAKKNVEIVGFIIFSKRKSGVSVLNWLLVIPAFRKRGIARKLISKWEKEAIKMKAHKLDSYTTNKDNVSFYKNLGFKLEGVRIFDQWKKNGYLLGKIVGK